MPPTHMLPSLHSCAEQGEQQLLAPPAPRGSAALSNAQGAWRSPSAGGACRTLTQWLARAGLAQGGRGCGPQLLTGGSFGAEVRGRRGGCALGMAAQLGQGWGHALVVPRGTQKVIEDL